VSAAQEGPEFSAAQVARACGGRLLQGSAHRLARGVSTDTRLLRPGQAFFALKGPNYDAHAFLPQALAAGAALVVVEKAPADLSIPPGTAVVRVQDTERALLALAAWHRRRLDARVIAVTGSYGKSTVKNMIGAILSRVAPCAVAPASYNNRVGVALTLLCATDRHRHIVLELGTNHPGEIDELARAALPHVGVITAIGEVHLEGLGDLTGVRDAKAEMIPHLSADGALALNADDALCASLGGRFEGRTLTFGLGQAAMVRAHRVRPTEEGWQFDALGWVYRVAAPRYCVLNALAALCVCQALGIPPGLAAQVLAEFRLPPLRYERRELGGVSFILDCYNSNPPAMRAALDSFMLEPAAGRRIVVCGDMLELGPTAPELHRQVGAAVAESGADVLVAVGELGRYVIEGWHSRAFPQQSALYFETAEQAWSPLWWEVRPGDRVLVKGSRRMKLETIAERISAHLARSGKEAA